MFIKAIEQINKKKSKVITEEGITLPLYIGEIRKNHIIAGEDLEDSIYDYIVDEVLYKRAKERAMYLLQASDKTVKQVRDKLAGGYYPPAVIDKTILFLEKYGYLDDSSYAASYISNYSSSLSKRMIMNKLLTKGISRDIIEEQLEERYVADSEQSKGIIRGLIKKKGFNYDEADPKERNRIISFLLRKGFEYDEIIDTMRHFEEDDY